jgi:hypothetical protein
MKITKHTYEAYFIDYTEGNLSEADKQELLLFLEQNPDLKEELEAYEAIILPAIEDNFADKDKLKKPVYTDKVLVAYIENKLNETERKEIETDAAEYAYVQKEIDLYKKTILLPDASIVYAEKERLKKREPVLIWNNPVAYFRAAAAILLLAGLYVLFSKKINTTKDIVLPKEMAVSKSNSLPDTIAVVSHKNKTQALISTQEQRIAVPKNKNIHTKKQEFIVKQEAVNTIAAAIETKGHIYDTIPKPSSLVNTSTHNNARQDSQIINSIALQRVKDVSYFNHATDIDDEELVTKQKSVDPVKIKKSFFDVVAAAIKGAKKIGLKDVDVKESAKENTFRIGGLAFSETISN